jgi:hypothetical protein
MGIGSERNLPFNRVPSTSLHYAQGRRSVQVVTDQSRFNVQGKTNLGDASTFRQFPKRRNESGCARSS